MSETLKVRVEEVGRSIAVQEDRHFRATGHTKFSVLKWKNIGMNGLQKYEMYVTKDCIECNKEIKNTKNLKPKE